MQLVDSQCFIKNRPGDFTRTILRKYQVTRHLHLTACQLVFFEINLDIRTCYEKPPFCKGCSNPLLPKDSRQGRLVLFF
jgi:hypothetical protein